MNRFFILRFFIPSVVGGAIVAAASPLSAQLLSDDHLCGVSAPGDGPGPNDGPAREARPPAPAPIFPLLRKGTPLPTSRQPQGILSGKLIYINAGHGWTASTSGAWSTQRGNNNNLIEDLGNIDQMTIFVDYLFNAGATIIPFRPVGNQRNEVVIDDGDARAEFLPAAAWSASTNPQYFGNASDEVSYRFASISAAETAVARYTPNIPEAGFYPVYTWARDGVDRVEDQLYRIVHTGGSTEVTVNHRRVGKGWVYLGQYYFDAGEAGYVEISNQSASTVGSVVIADAIRFGNGMGDINRGAGISGKAREDEASRYWVQAGLGQGASSTIYDQPGLNDVDDNVSTPTRMSAWMNNEADGTLTDRLFLSFHSNAFDPGSLGLYNGNNIPASATPNQQRWAFLIANELNTDMVAIGSPPFEHPWPDRVALGLSLVLDRTDIEFGEIRGDRNNNEMDATIIEVAAHGNATEARVMLDLKARRAVARGSVQAMVRYFNEFGGDPLIFPPDTPTGLWANSTARGAVFLGWDRPSANFIVGDEPTAYAIYRSFNGYGYVQTREVDGADVTSILLDDVPAGETVYYRVAAQNAAGQSIWSEPVAVYRQPNRSPRVLIVNGFDRIDRLQNSKESAPSLGTFDRVKAREINAGDYVVQHAEALAPHGVGFVSCSNEAVYNRTVHLDEFEAVVWILGEESVVDETFNFTERALLEEFQQTGGSIFVSGAYIGRHLVLGNADPGFYGNVLKAQYLGNDANSYAATGRPGSIFDGLSFDFSPGPGRYDVDEPDFLAPVGEATALVRYGSLLDGGIQFAGGSPEHRVVMLGFPFEMIRGEEVRADAMGRVLEFFALRSSGGDDIWTIF